MLAHRVLLLVALGALQRAGGQVAYSYGSGANFSGIDMLAAAVAMEEGKISASSA